MYLKRIELQGFKSFADKTALDLRPGLTAIVGPNGSGKSNISDAVRWVLGEQSNKNLRGKASADMIFSGSGKRARVGKAQVSLVLDNSDGAAPLEYPEIVITRKLSRSGDSEYLINKSPVRLNDILLFLAKANFGQKSFAVVGQGSVEEILNSTPQERKSYFDEAVGVKEFQLKRDQSINKLRRTDEHLQEAARLIEEIEPRLRNLTRSVKKLEKRERFEQQLVEFQTEYYGATWKEIHVRLKDNQALEKRFEGEQSTHESAIQKLQEQSEELADVNGHGNEYEELQSEIHGLEEKKNALIREQVVLRGQLELEHQKSGGQEQAWLVRRQQELESEENDAKNLLASLPTTIQSLKSKIQDAENAHTEVQQQLKDTEYELLKIEHNITDKAALSLTGVRSELATIHAEHKTMLQELMRTKDMSTFRDVQKRAENLYEQYDAFMKKLDASLTQAPSADTKQLSQKLERIAKDKERLLSQATNARIELSRREDQATGSEQRLAEIQRELREVESKLKSAKTGGSAKTTQTRIQDEHAKLQKDIDTLDAEISKKRENVQALHAKQQEAKQRLLEIQQKIRGIQEQLNSVVQQRNNVHVEVARLETRREDLENEMRHEPIQAHIEKVRKWSGKVDDVDTAELDQKIERIKRQLDLIGGIEPETIEEYEQTKERYEFLTSEREDLECALEQLHKVVDELDHKIKSRFQDAFKNINKDFKHFFKMLFGGGNASLELLHEVEEPEVLIDPETGQPLEEPEEERTPGPRKKIISGIEIDVQPPGKKLKTLSALSGGEKALTSIALLSAIIHNNPSPFVILDEVEAALDEANSERFANIIEELGQKTQFIIVTHNRATMNRADVLFGVSMGDDGVSKLLSVKLEDISDKVIGKGSSEAQTELTP